MNRPVSQRAQASEAQWAWCKWVLQKVSDQSDSLIIDGLFGLTRLLLLELGAAGEGS